MKNKIIIAVLTLQLSGCALYDAYFMAKYDTNEYALVNSVKTKSFLAQADCNDRNKTIMNVNELYNTSYQFRNFTFHIPRNEDATKMAEKLVKLTGDTKDFYTKNEKVSEVFCKAKLQQVFKSADEIQSTLGRKPR